MKRTPLKRKHTIRKISDKQAIEIGIRCQLKRELIEEHGRVCMTCNNKNLDWRGISFSHIIALSQGGTTTKKNCILECLPCHERFEKHSERRPEFQQQLVKELCELYRISYRGDE